MKIYHQLMATFITKFITKTDALIHVASDDSSGGCVQQANRSILYEICSLVTRLIQKKRNFANLCIRVIAKPPLILASGIGIDVVLCISWQLCNVASESDNRNPLIQHIAKCTSLRTADLPSHSKAK